MDDGAREGLDAEVLAMARVVMAERHGREASAEDLRAALRLVERRIAARTGLPSDPRELRRTIFRRLWRECFPAATFTGAAKAIASAWTLYDAGEGGAPLPGSTAEAFERLAEAGVRRLAWRTIAEDLDHSGDGFANPCKPTAAARRL